MSTLRLSELCALVDDTLKMAFHDRAWWIMAEVNEVKLKPQRIDLELVEKKDNSPDIIARLTGRAWRKEALAAFRNFEDITGKQLEKGMQVLLKVGVNYHPVYGLSLELFNIDSQHMLGQLELQRRQTIAQLAAQKDIRLVEGVLHTPNKNLPLGPVVQHVALITSASAAGYQDFVHTLEQNKFGYKFSVTPYFSVLQGEKAAGQMKEQLLKIYQDTQDGKKYDAVVMIRGGGAQSDLLPFDNFHLAHAVARIPIPVITGIGHQRNESIVDMVAHTTAKTPTEAAELLIAQNRTFEEEVMGLRELIILRTNNLLTKNHRKLDHTGTIICNGAVQLLHTSGNILNRVREKITAGTQKFTLTGTRELEELQRNISTHCDRYFERQKHRLEISASCVKHTHPENVLKRGYAMISKNDQLITSVSKIEKGDHLQIIFHDGQANSTVDEKQITSQS